MLVRSWPITRDIPRAFLLQQKIVPCHSHVVTLLLLPEHLGNTRLQLVRSSVTNYSLHRPQPDECSITGGSKHNYNLSSCGAQRIFCFINNRTDITSSYMCATDALTERAIFHSSFTDLYRFYKPSIKSFKVPKTMIVAYSADSSSKITTTSVWMMDRNGNRNSETFW